MYVNARVALCQALACGIGAIVCVYSSSISPFTTFPLPCSQPGSRLQLGNNNL